MHLQHMLLHRTDMLISLFFGHAAHASAHHTAHSAHASTHHAAHASTHSPSHALGLGFVRGFDGGTHHAIGK